MVKLKLWALFTTVVILLSCSAGCSPKTPPTDYRESSFVATAELSDQSGSATAKITADRSSVSMELITPDSLSGIALVRENGENYILCGDMRMPSSDHGYLLEWLDMIIPAGKIILTGNTKIDGLASVGAVVEGQDVEIYFDKSTYAPLKIIKNGRCVTLTAFEFVP